MLTDENNAENIERGNIGLLITPLVLSITSASREIARTVEPF